MVHAVVVDKLQTVFHSGTAVRNFRKTVAPHFFLFLETERTVIRRDDLERIFLQPFPQFVLMPFFAKRRSEDVFGSLKIRPVEILDRKSRY